ncbi:MAG: acyltransferase [Magnetococcales bacterium]|nr:acyltransferase [Magnetococcales bacterium]
MKYRKEIDGLRAVAVLAVISFHGEFVIFKGGYVGVDIFFVISGFLITTILMNDLKSGELSILDFYERRARRILPALMFVLGCTVLLSWVCMFPDQIENLSKTLIATLFYSSNFMFWQTAGYYTVGAQEMPLLHTWSLSVEEQYYLVFPFILAFLWRKKRGWLVLSLIFVGVASFTLSEWGWRHSSVANFYLIPSRAWELLLGSLAAIYHLRSVDNSSKLIDNTIATIGLLMVLSPIFLFNKSTPNPSYYTLIPTLGTVAVILYANSGTLVNRILSLKLLVGVGLISYSAYLWHYPIYAFSRILSIEKPSLEQSVLSGVGALTLGYLSWKFIEKPFRDKQTIPLRTLLIWIGTSTTILLFIGISGYASSGYKNLYLNKDGQKFLAEYTGRKDSHIPYRYECNFYFTNTIQTDCLYQKKEKKKVTLVWGGLPCPGFNCWTAGTIFRPTFFCPTYHLWLRPRNRDYRS